MTRNYCDRCGAEIKRPFKKCLMINRVYYRGIFGFGPEKENIVYHEICKECQESLGDWWINTKEKGEQQ